MDHQTVSDVCIGVRVHSLKAAVIGKYFIASGIFVGQTVKEILMQEIAKLNNIVGKISKLENVTTVFASSRAGVFAMGVTPKMTDRAMFSAITSMMLGAAEQMGREMGDDLSFIELYLTESKMIILGAGPKHLIGLLVDQKTDVLKLATEVKAIIAAP
ncbi:MAG TPA: hypothetical protein VLH13_05005 [Methanomassiliicoccales archaeon]|nr:hypothetical protein [Methanomassiliicoccales archaeon]